MKKITFFTLLFSTLGFSQGLHTIDFEPAGTGSGWNWTADSVAPSFTELANPVSGGINTSATVVEFIAYATDNNWALCYTDDDGEFTFDGTNSTVKIMVYKSTISDVGIKFEGSSPAIEKLVPNTLINQWEELTFDFSGEIGNTYSRIVIIPDFVSPYVDGTDRPTDNTVYFDNLVVPDGVVTTPPALPSPASQPTTPDAKTYSISSDTGGYTNGFDYVNGCFGVLAGEPDLDTGAGVNKAFKFDFSVAGWGCTNSADADVSVLGGDPIAYASFQYYTDDATDFFFDLISNSAGTTESFYYVGQSAAGGAPTADIAIVQGSWQHVIIPISEFTSQTFDPTKLFQFKFDVFAGATPGIIYVDNVLLSSVSPTLGVKNVELSQLNVYPNPSESIWNVKTNNQILNSIQVFDILGKQVLTLNPNATNAVIDATNLSNGLYFAKVKTDNGSSILKLIKN
jgi:hypothetical protein